MKYGKHQSIIEIYNDLGWYPLDKFQFEQLVSLAAEEFLHGEGLSGELTRKAVRVYTKLFQEQGVALEDATYNAYAVLASVMGLPKDVHAKDALPFRYVSVPESISCLKVFDTVPIAEDVEPMTVEEIEAAFFEGYGD